jgi:hypothetical protein
LASSAGPGQFADFRELSMGTNAGTTQIANRGAIIHLVAWKTLPKRRGDESLTGWARLDSQNAKSGTVKSRDFGVPLSTGISVAAIWSFDDATFSPDDQPQREVNIYWMFNGEKFACYLSYVVGDPKATQYQNALKDLVTSIRPI